MTFLVAHSCQQIVKKAPMLTAECRWWGRDWQTLVTTSKDWIVIHFLFLLPLQTFICKAENPP